MLPKMTPPATLHEGDVFGIALRRLEADLRSENVQAVDEIRQEGLLRDVAANGYSPDMLSRLK
jgi:hypothetical protein